ncbi:primary-amine oxidase [Anabaena sp. FACHB-709]|uniref:Amine oxidase n=2 Tax=Nostocaceae TaxID=1162 RepID=A0A1Z4KJ97_ANAVA|nr:MULTISPECIES: primary-amine oxidase [Nostocaceae]BAY69060.1 copper amine oxidase [Trichormus variabilis NIES-23]HBW30282.1 tyramine oxidase [Nostoc sp. UBA8866]MBD2173846.1 primary-amine oxidase [Anabaena cylindrica FACHB-318]MBD2265591.1 primary-amine oxidase [Anabaena sp. FACHB-709]MBD2274886.1 primary-amine oxidase [Nostoc sp. PCC 7120 = FACHB-418]
MIKRLKLFFLLAITIIICCGISLILIETVTAKQPVISHPLTALTEAEIKTAVALIRKEKSLTDMAAFPLITLAEPDKQEVRNFTQGQSFERKAFLVVYERAQNKTYEGIVDLKTQKIASWQEKPHVQPAIFNSEYELARNVVKSDSRWQEAMKKRGITDFDQVQVSCWAAGILSQEEAATGGRLCRTLLFYRGERWNYYGSPIEGVIATVDLNKGTVTNFIDQGIVPISKENWNYDLQSLGKLLSPPKLLQILQPKGKSFQIQGNEVTWQGWKFRYVMHPRDGLVLYQVNYKDGGNVRPVLYRASLSEMVVPYGDPDPTWSFRNAFDVGEYNLGLLASTMELGKEIPQNGVLFDAVFANEEGEPYVMPGVVGIYERDNGILWKHYEYNTQRNDVRRDRQLVITITAAVDNYDYGINWIFHQDGTLEVENDLTGIVLVQGTEAETQPEDNFYGRLLAKNIFGVNHQHFFNYRLDMDVDGQANNVMEMNVASLPIGKNNPIGNAIVVKDTPLKTEKAAVRDLDIKHSREWMIANADKKNALGVAPAYMLMPGGNTVFFPVEGAKIRQKAEFATHHVWVTRYKPHELYAGGDYPNQAPPGKGLPEYIADDESLMGQDIVLWYTMGITHVPKPEDWPVMPVHKLGFKLSPRGFFSRNPAINLPE